MTTPEPSNTTRRELPVLLKLALELGPLILFFIANSRPDLFTPLSGALLGPELLAADNSAILIATAVFMVAMLSSLTVTWMLARRLPVMPLVSGIVVLIFGGLTLILQDETFIKLKPTIVNVLFGTILLGGLALGKPLLPYVLESVLSLTSRGWHVLTLRWGLFFFFLAILNEVVWRTQSTEFWVGFKVWGVTPITLVFAMAQAPMLQRYANETGEGSA